MSCSDLVLGWRAEQATHQTLITASARLADSSEKQDELLGIKPLLNQPIIHNKDNKLHALNASCLGLKA